MAYDGSATNLHSVWDSAIAESIAGGSAELSAKSWASTLTTGMVAPKTNEEGRGELQCLTDFFLRRYQDWHLQIFGRWVGFRAEHNEGRRWFACLGRGEQYRSVFDVAGKGDRLRREQRPQ